MTRTSPSPAITAIVVVAFLLGPAIVLAQDDPDEPLIDDIIEPVGLPSEDVYEEEGGQQPGEQAAEPAGEPAAGPAAGVVLENTVALCQDDLDNDADDHADCDDQDCEIFAICVEPAPAAAAAAPAATPAPEAEGQTAAAVPAGYKRAESPKIRLLRVFGHVALWSGIGIAAITTGLRFSDDPETCAEDDGDFLGVCSGWGWAVGGALAATGVILLSIYHVKKKRIRESNPDLALVVSPLLGQERYGAGAVIVF